ncbi:hypothetical protein [Deinococcus sp. JMULE3]|uniref:hypothetical protein n=1 Tax=Deinococcus sp. JMULE3 TaxID=2518341 RepID=UPI0015761006|nr:hypothetical protein [Deinococcus sp. JMULE3]NTX99411.1 hypothetical protein [Deinococcus sp. JMULE3]
MTRTRTTLTLLAALLTTATAAQVSIPIRVTVRAACEVSRVDEQTLALRCTKDFSPTDPRTLPELSGRLPGGEWRLNATSEDPSGGTLNVYTRVPTAGTGSAADSAELIYY